MIIREQQPADRASVRAVIVAAFQEERVADLAEALEGSGYVAEDEGRVVGHVMLSHCWVDAPQRLVDVLVLSPLSVTPALQRRGVGGQLVRHALAEAGKAGAPALFLEGSPAYYPRFGFEPAAKHGFAKPSVRIPDAAFQVVLLPAHEPWMTGALVYCDPFWRFDCVGLRD